MDKLRYRSDTPGGFRRARKNLFAVGLALALWGARFAGIIVEIDLAKEFAFTTAAVFGVAALGLGIHQLFVPAIEMLDTTLTIRDPEEPETVRRISFEDIEAMQVSKGGSRNRYLVRVATT